MSPQEERICRQCERGKPLSEFGRYRNRVGDLMHKGTCKACLKDKLRDWRKANPDLDAATRKSWRDLPENRQSIREADSRYYARNKAKRNQANKAYRERSPEQIALRKREWRLNNLERVQNNRLITNYGITLEHYLKLLEEQGGVCRICRDPETRSITASKKPMNLVVDHDHFSGRVRGLLCSACNVGIGHLRESPNFLRAAADYLEQHGAGD